MTKARNWIEDIIEQLFEDEDTNKELEDLLKSYWMEDIDAQTLIHELDYIFKWQEQQDEHGIH